MLSTHFALPPAPAIELRAFTHGLMPNTVPAMMERFLHDWQHLGVDAWNGVPDHWTGKDLPVGWWSLPEFLGDHYLSPLLGAAPGTCIFVPSVHHALSMLMSAPEVAQTSKKVVVSEDAFPSVLHTMLQWAELRPLEVVVLPLTSDGWVDREAFLSHAASAGLVCVSHVSFLTGERLEDSFLRELADAVHAGGGRFLVDGYHATGSLAVRVEEIGCDIYVGGLLKEGCGSSGNSFIYVRPGLDVHPKLTGWFGDAVPFAFAPKPEPNKNVRRRFLGGTTAIAPLYHAVEGVKVLLEAGMDEVERYVLHLVEVAHRAANALHVSLRSPTDPSRRSALVMLDVPRADLLCTWLKQKQIFTDSRKGHLLRFAPFVWNTEAEIERTFAEIALALETGEYLLVQPEAGHGPVT